MSHTSKLKYEDFMEIKDSAHSEILNLPAKIFMGAKEIESIDTAKLAVIKATLRLLVKKGLISSEVDFDIGRPAQHYSNEDNA